MLQPPSKSINIDSAFEQACVSPQVEPNYCETPQEASASGRTLKTINWLDWENKTKWRQINNNKKPAVQTERDQSRVAAKSRSNAQRQISVYVGSACCFQFRDVCTTYGSDERASTSCTHTDICEYVRLCYPVLLSFLSPCWTCAWNITLNRSLPRPCSYLWPLYPQSYGWLLSTKLVSKQTSKHQQSVNSDRYCEVCDILCHDAVVAPQSLGPLWWLWRKCWWLKVKWCFKRDGPTWEALNALKLQVFFSRPSCLALQL